MLPLQKVEQKNKMQTVEFFSSENAFKRHTGKNTEVRHLYYLLQFVMNNLTSNCKMRLLKDEN